MGRGERACGPLHYAAIRGDKALAKTLLDHGAQINARDTVGMTPLHASAFEGKADIAEILLVRGADPSPRDQWDTTPLQYAQVNGHSDVEALLRTSAETAPTPSGPTRNEKGARRPLFVLTWMRRRSAIHDPDLLRLGALGALGDFASHLLPLGEGFEARTLDVAVMDEGILAALDRDESETLFVVKPLHNTVYHVTLLDLAQPPQQTVC